MFAHLNREGFKRKTLWQRAGEEARARYFFRQQLVEIRKRMVACVGGHFMPNALLH